MKINSFSAVALTAFLLCLPACDRIKDLKEMALPSSASPEPGALEAAASETQADSANHSGEQDGVLASLQHGTSAGQGHDSESLHGDKEHGGGEHHAVHKVVVTSALAKDVDSTRRFVCQIRSRRHIEIRALEGGYLESIPVSEGQTVKQGELMFKILPTLYQAKLNSDLAEAKIAQIEYDNTSKLVRQNIVSPQELALAKAKLEQAKAKVQLAQAELDFANVKAPFDGIMDRLHEQQGSLIEEGDILTTLSDNSVMWVYFNVPEARYLEYREAINVNKKSEDLHIELILANHKVFPQPGKIGAIEADFNNETGNIAFRGDFANPDGLLRHGQTGTVLMHHLLKDAVVIPQRAKFEILAKQYVYVVGEDHVVRQREIQIETEMEDIFVIESGLKPGERIVLEGVRQVRDGEEVQYQYRDPADVLSNLKNHAE